MAKSEMSDTSDGLIATLLGSFNEGTKITAEGAVSFGGQFQFNSEEVIIAEQMKLSTQLTSGERQSIVRRALIELRRAGPVTASSLVERCRSGVVDELRRVPAPYALWTRLRLSQMSSSKRFRLVYGQVTIEGLTALPDAYRLEPYFLSGIGDINPNEHNGFPAVIGRCKARTDDQAADAIFDAFDTFFALTNLYFAVWNIFGGEHKREAKLSSYRYQFLFRRRRISHAHGQWFDPEFDDEEWGRSVLKYADFEKRLPIIRKGLIALESHPLKTRLVRALKQIHDGMCSRNTTYRLLRFWSALESIFAENENASSDTIIKRALFGEKDRALTKIKLEYIASVRNSYVHAGQEGVGIYYLVQFLRDFVSLHLRYLIHHGSDFESHKAFIEMASLPHDLSDLAIKQTAISRRLKVIEFGKHN